MSGPKINLGSDTKPVWLDVMKLLDSRLLVQASSGAGKSWLLRLIAEQLTAHVPVIILDREGEFATLREKCDMVLVGGGGEVAASVSTAKHLARKLVELKVSAVIDLSDLEAMVERRQFVRDFLDGLMDVPKTLWGHLAVMVDEAHDFAPQHGDAVSLMSVNALLCQGRKRGFGGMLATQRLSKTHKDAAAECHNIIIGRTSPIDQERAADMLGIKRQDRGEFSRLEPGEWFGFGPAFGGNEVVRFHAGRCKTTHPQAGQRHQLTAPRPSKAIAAVLGEFAGMEAKAKEEKDELKAAQARLRDLEQQLRTRPTTPTSTADPAAVDRAVAAAVASRDRFWGEEIGKVQRAHRSVVGRIGKIEELCKLNGDAHVEVAAPTSQPVTAARFVARPVAPRQASGDSQVIPKGERSILIAVAQYAEGVNRDQLSVLTGYKRSTRDAYLQRLGERGFIAVDGASVTATDKGVGALGTDYEPLPTGAALQAHWASRLPEGERRILEVLIAAYPNPVSRDAIGEATEFKRSTRDAYIQRLTSRRLVTSSGRGDVIASDTLF